MQSSKMCFSLTALRHELEGPCLHAVSLLPSYGPEELATILAILHVSSRLDHGDFVAAAKRAGIVVGSGGAALIGVPLLGTVALTTAGFTGSGIAAGTAAAAWQSTMGGMVAAGSTFSTFQSIGATGGFAILGPLGLAAGVVGGAIAAGGVFAYNHFKKKKRPYFVLIYLHV